jgi:heme-degrading monooxygenase HmoA
MRHARIVVYELAPRSADEVIRRAIAGMAPIFERQVGYVSYQLLKANEDTVISYSVWADHASAEAATRVAATWVRQNLDEFFVSSRVYVAQVSYDSHEQEFEMRH